VLIFTPFWQEIDIFYFKFGFYGKNNLRIGQSQIRTKLVTCFKIGSFWAYLTRKYYLKLYRKKQFFELQKIPLNNFPPNASIWIDTLNVTCMRKIRMGHWAKFRDNNKCFVHVLFPVCTILRCIFTSRINVIPFNCITHPFCASFLAWLARARAHAPSELYEFSMKAELFSEINGRFLLNELGDPHFLIHKFKWHTV